MPKESSTDAQDLNFLVRIKSGDELFNVIGGADGYQFANDTLQNEPEVSMVSDFLQELHDWGEIWDDIEPGGRIQMAYAFCSRIAELGSSGLWVFALRLPRPFGCGQKQVVLSIATVYIVRSKYCEDWR